MRCKVPVGLGIVVWCAVAGCTPGDAGGSGDAGDYGDAGAPGTVGDSGGPGASPAVADSPQQPQTPVIRDSAGIRIIENARPADGSWLPWRIGAEPLVSIGEYEGDEPYLLDRVVGALTLSDRRVVVGNGGTNEIRVYDAEGVHLVTWGGTGGGPGEFQSLEGLVRWPGDSILAHQTAERGSGGGSYLFDHAGNLGRSFRTQAGVGVPFEPRIALADGRVLGRTRISGGSDDGGRTDREDYYRFEAAYEVLAADDTTRVPLDRYPDLEMAELLYQGVMLHLGLPFSRRARDASWGNLVVIGSTDRYEFHAYDGSSGSVVRIVRRDHAYRAPTRDEVIEATEEFIEDEVPEQHARMVRGAVAEAPIVEMLPAFRSVLGDALGHLWVEEYALPGAEARAPLWTVFDPEGRALGFVETPAGLTLFEIGPDYVLGLATDELGIERVQVWALERG